MASIEKTDNIVSFPVIPRATIPINPEEADSGINAKQPLTHGLTPMKAMKVQYWHQGQQSISRKPESSSKKRAHAKRADQFGLLLLGCAFLVVALVVVTLYLNNKKYLYATSKVNEGSTAVVDFYQGNYTFASKVAEEKAAKQQKGYQVHGLTTVNEDLEVPLSDQMSSMSDKMKKMRSLQQANEAPPPSPDTGPKPDLSPLKPTTDANFKSPLELNNSLPKVLQKTP